MNRFELVVFDWDGTLADSEQRILAAMRGAIDELALPPRGDDAIRDIIGLGLTEAVGTLFPGVEADLCDRFRECYGRHFQSHPRPLVELFDGVETTLGALREGGYRLAVATSKGRRGLDRALEASGLGGMFDVTRCADEAPSKPHPRMLIDVMTHVGAAPRRTLMVGDTEYDLLMARAAGAHALAVGYGVQPAERLLRHAPLGCLDRISDLNGWLDRAQAASAASGVADTDGR